jgi:histidine triad (HIT) family protein
MVSVAGCAFCAIAQGNNRSVQIVDGAENWVAFFPDNPTTPGHTLVIPRTHVTDLWQVEPPLDADLMAAVIRVGRVIDRALEPEGMNLITSAGKTAEQTVFHLHLHLVPRWRRDGFGRIWPLDDKYEDSELGDVADRIRKAAAADGARGT